MRGNEWPLIIFTLLMQASVGVFLALSVVYTPLFIKGNSIIPKEVTGKLFLCILPLIFIAGVAAFFHLGSPKNAWYALSNMSDSWLSREILFTIIYSVIVSVVSLLVYKEVFSPMIRHLLIIVCAVFGVVLVFVMSRLYMLETVPAWDSCYTPGAFLLSAIVLGGFSFLAILLYISGQNNINLFTDLQTGPIIKLMLFVIALFTVVELGTWLLHLRSLSGGVLASRESYSLVFDKHIFLFAGRIICGVLTLAILSYTIYNLPAYGLSGKIIDASRHIFWAYGLFLLTEIIGRYLFYAMYARTGV